MRKSMLPEGGKNKFQEIKEIVKKARDNGILVIDLSVGQPHGPAFLRARQVAAEMIMSDDEGVHSYQDNLCFVTGFARLFAEKHMARPLGTDDDVLPIPGIKPMLKIVIEACGSEFRPVKVLTMTNPGYPTPADACRVLRNVTNYAPRLNSENGFLFTLDDIEEGTTILMVNIPHNPSGVVADASWWRTICAWCEQNHIRIFNDAAYKMLAYSPDICTLADIAPEFPNLSWAEAYSASKVGNFTGWRAGVIVGSKDLIEDIRKCKGKADSGLVAPMAAGALEAVMSCKSEIEECRLTYLTRQETLINILSRRFGMKLAVAPGAGFFSLWLAPQMAFGQKIESGKEFNDLMIAETGIVGVPFDEFIRYSVTEDIHAPGVTKAITAGFQKAQIAYA